MSYLSSVLADAPTHYWRCADPGGVLAQDIGSAAHIPLFCDYQFAFPYSGPASDGGAAVRLPANHITTGPVFPIAVGNNWTMEVWFWLPWNDSTMRGLFSIVQAGGVHPQTMYLQTTDCLGGAIPGVGGFNSAVVATPRSWHQAAITYDNATFRVYQDGVQLGSAAFVSASVGNYGVAIGTREDGTGPTQGFFAEAALYPTTLAAARIAAHDAAADFATFYPIYAGAGATDVPTGSGATSATSFQDVLSSVRRVY